MASVLDKPVIVLSRSYLPMAKTTVRDAIVLIIKGKALPVELDDSKSWVVRSINCHYLVPHYVVLQDAGSERVWKLPPPSRREIIRRDKGACQYCGSKKDPTIDHVLPTSRGGQNTWENLVTACGSCNQFKGNRIPEEAGMKLSHIPKAPIHPTLLLSQEIWGTESLTGLTIEDYDDRQDY